MVKALNLIYEPVKALTKSQTVKVIGIAHVRCGIDELTIEEEFVDTPYSWTIVPDARFPFTYTPSLVYLALIPFTLWHLLTVKMPAFLCLCHG